MCYTLLIFVRNQFLNQRFSISKIECEWWTFCHDSDAIQRWIKFSGEMEPHFHIMKMNKFNFRNSFALMRPNEICIIDSLRIVISGTSVYTMLCIRMLLNKLFQNNQKNGNYYETKTISSAVDCVVAFGNFFTFKRFQTRLVEHGFFPVQFVRFLFNSASYQLLPIDYFQWIHSIILIETVFYWFFFRICSTNARTMISCLFFQFHLDFLCKISLPT